MYWAFYIQKLILFPSLQVDKERYAPFIMSVGRNSQIFASKFQMATLKILYGIWAATILVSIILQQKSTEHMVVRYWALQMLKRVAFAGTYHGQCSCNESVPKWINSRSRWDASQAGWILLGVVSFLEYRERCNHLGDWRIFHYTPALCFVCGRMVLGIQKDV